MAFAVGVRARNGKRKRGGLAAGGHVTALPATPYSQNSGEAEDSKFRLKWKKVGKPTIPFRYVSE